MSKIAGAVFNHIKDLRSFTTRDIASYFPAVPFNILKEAVKESKLWKGIVKIYNELGELILCLNHLFDKDCYC